MTSAYHNAVLAWHNVKARLLANMPELADDPDCLLDTIDGATDTKEQMTSILRHALREEAEAKGLDEHIQRLEARKAAKKERAQKLRALVLRFMSDADVKHLSAPDMTITRKTIPPAVSIYDETQLPDTYVRVKREPDKTAIKSALKDGKFVSGARLGNGGETLQVRV